MTVLAPLFGYLIGSLPTANGLARLWGVDLRITGSGNPGASNARRAGGYTLAAVVLLVEIGKGLAAVVIGLALAGEPGAVVAGIAAVGGNVYNVWYRLRGGKGLGISAGVVVGLWPTAFPILLAVIIGAALLTRSSGKAALAALGALLLLSIVWPLLGLGTAWGLERLTLLPWLALGLSLIMFQKHLRDAVDPLRRFALP